jgi:hypothetical protein
MVQVIQQNRRGMSWLRWYIVVMALILGLYLFAEYSRAPELDWRPTLSSHDKIPFGTWILFHEFGNLYDEKPREIREDLYSVVNNRLDSGLSYVMVEPALPSDKAAEKELLRFISGGNTVFLSTDELSNSLEDTLKLKLSATAPVLVGKDSLHVSLVNPRLDSTRRYTMVRNTIDGYFKTFDTARAEVLGMQDGGRPNFLRMRIGKGMLYLHAAPMMLTNFSLLEAGNRGYVEAVFSYLPMDATEILWDEYYKIGKGEPETPLRVILSRPYLRYAWFTSLFALLTFLVFAAKRRQRIIPVVEPPVNATLDFVGTVSRVYYNGKDHRGIALKRMTYWLDQVRTQYGMNTTTTDAAFAQVLASKSGAAAELVKALSDWCAALRGGMPVNDKELLTFSGLIDQFQKSTIS